MASAGTAADAFDNNTGTYWLPGLTYTNEGWIGYDFGSGNSKDIIEFAITARTTFHAETPTIGVLEWSDDNSVWVPSFYYKASAWASGSQQVFSDSYSINLSGGHRYWRVYVDTQSPGAAVPNRLGGTAVEMYVTGNANDIAPLSLSSVTVDDGNADNNKFPRDMIDFKVTTDWASSGTNPFPHWIALDFGSGNEPAVTSVWWRARNVGYQEGPGSGSLQYSDNGSDWSLAGSFSGMTWTADQLQELVLVNALVRSRGYIIG